MMAVVHQGDSVASQLPDTRSVGAVQLCCPQAPLHRAQLGHDLGSIQLANTMISTRKTIYHSGRYCIISLSTYIASENQLAKPCILSPANVTRRDNNILVVRDLEMCTSARPTLRAKVLPDIWPIYGLCAVYIVKSRCLCLHMPLSSDLTDRVLRAATFWLSGGVVNVTCECV
jgi:hypothetical protein